MAQSAPGLLVLMGSGEMTPGMAAVHRRAMSLVASPIRAVFVDTPAGFQLNADLIAEKAIEYFKLRLNCNLTQVAFKSAANIPLREAQAAAVALQQANYIFAGPGSPTYAIDNWRGTLVLDAMLAALDHGAALVLSSAAALTVGRYTIPVYEIYKVGEQPHWVEGLDILGHYGFEVCVVPHWNNTSGGDHDTRYCFVGELRWVLLEPLLPASTTVLGIDENTACILRLSEGVGEVAGRGRVTLRRAGVDQIFRAGEQFSLDLLRSIAAGDIRQQDQTQMHGSDEELSAANVSAYMHAQLEMLSSARQRHEWDRVQQAEEAMRRALMLTISAQQPTSQGLHPDAAPFVDLLVRWRNDLRTARQWAQADSLREVLLELGVLIEDTREGSTWRWADPAP